MQFPVETESNTAFDRMGAKAASMTLANCCTAPQTIGAHLPGAHNQVSENSYRWCLGRPY
jgi:hypothetical protein